MQFCFLLLCFLNFISNFFFSLDDFCSLEELMRSAVKSFPVVEENPGITKFFFTEFPNNRSTLGWCLRVRQLFSVNAITLDITISRIIYRSSYSPLLRSIRGTVVEVECRKTKGIRGMFYRLLINCLLIQLTSVVLVMFMLHMNPSSCEIL